jgi:hypothetical protein
MPSSQTAIQFPIDALVIDSAIEKACQLPHRIQAQSGDLRAALEN